MSPTPQPPAEAAQADTQPIYTQNAYHMVRTALQANLTAEQNAEIDHLVDGKLRQIGETEEGLVIDSRTAWHWIPDSRLRRAPE